MALPNIELLREDIELRQEIETPLRESGIAFGELPSNRDRDFTAYRLLSRHAEIDHYTDVQREENKMFLVETVVVPKSIAAPAVFEFYFVDTLTYEVKRLNVRSDELFRKDLQVVYFKVEGGKAIFWVALRSELPQPLPNILLTGALSDLDALSATLKGFRMIWERSKLIPEVDDGERFVDLYSYSMILPISAKSKNQSRPCDVEA